MNLTPHFSFDQVSFSSTARRLGIDNTIPQDLIPNTLIVAENLERIRRDILMLFTGNIIIDSWYRCPKLNAAIGGSKNSAHMTGYAVDIICPIYGTPYEIAKAINDSSLLFDQLILEGTWVHLSFDPKARRQVLTANFQHGVAYYVQGLTHEE